MPAEQARWFGDDISFKRDGYETLAMNTAQTIAFFVRRVGSGGTGRDRAQRLATSRPGIPRDDAFLTTHTAGGPVRRAASVSTPRLRIAIAQALRALGRQGPAPRLAGAAIAGRAARAGRGRRRVFSRTRGLDAACAIVSRHRGGQFDPAVVDAFCDRRRSCSPTSTTAAEWDAVVAAEPGLERTRHRRELDRVLEAMADLIDMKSPYTAGHSRGVAHLAATAAAVSGLPVASATLRRAGLIHDLGRLGVSNTIWDKPAR